MQLHRSHDFGSLLVCHTASKSGTAITVPVVPVVPSLLPLIIVLSQFLDDFKLVQIFKLSVIVNSRVVFE